MTTLSLKDVPPELHQRLRALAEAHGRSLNKEIIASLERVTAPTRVNIPQYLSRIARIHQQIDFEVTLDEIQEAIHVGRP